MKNGEGSKAIEFYQIAIDFRKLLANEYPDRRDYQNELASDHNNLGTAYWREKSLSSATDQFAVAMTIRSAMDRESAPEWELNGLAISYSSLADIYRIQTRQEEASKNYKKAIETRHRIAELSPDDAGNRYKLAGHHISLGSAFLQTGNPQLAETQFVVALELQTQLVADQPDDLRFEIARLGSHVNVSLCLRDQRQYRESLEMLMIAETGLSDVLDKHPQNPTANAFLVNSHTAQANTHNLFARHLIGNSNEDARQQSAEHARLACELTNWNRSDCITTFAFVSAKLGEFEKAVELQKKAIEKTDEQSKSELEQRLQLYRQRKLPSKPAELSIKN